MGRLLRLSFKQLVDALLFIIRTPGRVPLPQYLLALGQGHKCKAGDWFVRVSHDTFQKGSEMKEQAADRLVLEEVHAVFDSRRETSIALKDVQAEIELRSSF